MYCYIVTGILFSYMLFDVHHFIRSGIVILVAKIFRRRISILEPSSVYGVVLPSDVDFTLDHMSNARVLREFDFGRMDFGTRTRILDLGLRKGVAFPVNANLIRYRLPIRPFSLYKVETRVTGWEYKHIYIEQKLITLRDGVVRAVAYPKVTLPDGILQGILDEISPDTKSPKIDDIVNNVNDACDIISSRFKKSD